MQKFEIQPIQESDYNDLAAMVGELLKEIMDKIKIQTFHFDPTETEIRAKDLISKEKYWVFIARETYSKKNAGFISLYESYALYAEGAYGTIPELYVYPGYRSMKVGQALLRKAISFGESKSWSRLEVTTPPLPEFDRALAFYKSNGFEISGGRKLKTDISF